MSSSRREHALLLAEQRPWHWELVQLTGSHLPSTALLRFPPGYSNNPTPAPACKDRCSLPAPSQPKLTQSTLEAPRSFVWEAEAPSSACTWRRSSGTWLPAGEGRGAAQRACVETTHSTPHHSCLGDAAGSPPLPTASSWSHQPVHQGHQHCINWACRGFLSLISLPLKVH